MTLKVVLFLLFTYASSKEDVKTTQKYPPCDNNILFGFETSLDLETFAFKKQIKFLTEQAFEEWTQFNYFALLRYGDMEYKKFGFFNSKDVLKYFIRDSEQIKTSNTICDVFHFLRKVITTPTRLLIFLREFSESDLSNQCYSEMDSLYLQNMLTFVPLSTKVNITVLKYHFKKVKVITWNIADNDSPDDWKVQFNDAYGCGIATTISTIKYTTTEEPLNHYPCNNYFFVIFDKSNGISNNEFQKEKNFLIKYMFQNWTSFGNLVVTSYANNSDCQWNCHPIGSRRALEEFINKKQQVDKAPSLCDIYTIIFNSMVVRNGNRYIIFVSQFDVQSFKLCRLHTDSNVLNFLNSITFVLLTDNARIDDLRHYFPLAQFIKWNIAEETDTPANWEWQFWAAYGCEDNHNPNTYPCGGNKVLVGYDESNDINESDFDNLKEFLINDLFDNKWNNFNNIALIAQSSEVRRKDFGVMKSLEDVHDFINNTTKTKVRNTPTSMCQTFKQLTTMYLSNINVVLFVSKFHEQIGDVCPLWLKEIRENVNSITFVSYNNQINREYLISKLPQSKFVLWNISKDKTPENWNEKMQKGFGCDDFYVIGTTYPCLNSIMVLYDRSHYLNSVAYRRLTSFLLDKVFIDQWTSSDNIHIFVYPREASLTETTFKTIKSFIRQTLRASVPEEPLICLILNEIVNPKLGYHQNIFFLNKFDNNVLDGTKGCNNSIDVINTNKMKLTFFALSSLVDKQLLSKTFPKATIVEWRIENEDVPQNWAQMLWEAFGCSGKTPIHFPQHTSTVIPTTKPLTTTTNGSSSLTSTTKASTTQLKTTSLITTTKISITSSKSSSSQNKSKEIILLGIFIPLLVIILIGVVAYFCWNRRKQRQQLVNVIASKDAKRNNNKHEKREEDVWEIQPELLQINFIDKLGSGAFGDVFIGKLLGPAPITQIYNDSPHCQRFHDCDVAVKALPAMQVDEYARNEFWKEIDFMKNLKFHQNLVCFLGYVYDPTNPLMLLEYCANGDLLKFIKSNKQKFVDSFENSGQEDSKTLISFAWQISSGLEYLSSLGLIHRDIAARNILLDKNNVCKVSDFGLCRLAEDLTYQSKGGKLPIRWMAIESLKDYVYSQKTDVWSYGVLLWELFSLGDLPYVDVESILMFIESGKRLEKPNYCSERVYELMLDCWLVDPDDRPTFTIICQLLTSLIETATMHYNYVDTLALIEEANQIEELDNVSVLI